jgi:simple sugar transport system permease protein
MPKYIRIRRWAAPVLSLLFALLIGALVILSSGNNPVEIYLKLFAGALGSRNSILQTLLQATPLLFCGLSVLMGMKAGLLNLGVEGQLYMGALAATLTGIYMKGLPSCIHIPLCMLAGMLGGAVWAFLPVWLKIKRGVHEVVTALMLNNIGRLFVEFMTNYPLREKNATVAQSVVLEPSAILPKLFVRSQVTAAILIGVVLAVLLSCILKYTVFGYQIILVGANKYTAAAGGVPVDSVLTGTMMISGLCAGLAGTMEVMGTHGRLIQGFSPGYGFDGIAVAVLGLSPVSAIFSSLLFGALRAGGLALSFGTNLSVKFINTLQGIIILLIAAPAFFSRFLNFFTIIRHKPVPKGSEL